MYYKKEEQYSFSLPREQEEYLRFKESLKKANVAFTEKGGSVSQIITITTSRRFNSNEQSMYILEV